jgi:hypothetical protein
MRDDDVLTNVERRLRETLRSDDERVNAVVNRALDSGKATRSPWRRRLVAAGTVALIALGAMVWRASSPPPASLTIWGSGSVIVVTSEDGRRWLVDERGGPSARGQYVIAVPQ